MIINGMPNHLHLLIGLKPDCNLSDLVRDIKANSSKWINENQFLAGKFEWQTGFGAFTVGQSQIQTVINYILNQEEHHRKKTFREEYIEFLNAYQIDYKTEYIFDDCDIAPTELKTIALINPLAIDLTLLRSFSGNGEIHLMHGSCLHL